MAASLRRLNEAANNTTNITRVIPGKSLTMIRVGGQEVPLYVGKKCRVCQSPYRFDIEKKLLAGVGQKTIAEQLPEENNYGDERITPKHISNHIHAQPSHCLPRVAALQLLVDARQQQLGRNAEDAVGFLADYYIAGNMMIQTYFERLMNGHELPSGGEVVSLIKLFADMDRETKGGLDTAAYNQLFMTMLDAVRELAPGAYERIVHRVTSNPIAQALEARARSIEATSSV